MAFVATAIMGIYLSELAEEFSDRPARVLTDLAHWAATRALAGVGLAEHPAFTAALERLADQPGTPLDPAAALLVRAPLTGFLFTDVHGGGSWST